MAVMAASGHAILIPELQISRLLEKESSSRLHKQVKGFSVGGGTIYR